MKTFVASSGAFAEEVATPAHPEEFPPVLDIATSTRVLRERRLAILSNSTRGIVLGRHFATFRGLAERCIAETNVEVHGILEPPAVTRLVRHCAINLDPFAAMVRNQPGIATALASTLRDLRDAGVLPHHLPESHTALRELHRRVEEALDRLREEHGLLDSVGLFREASRGAAAWARRLGLTRAEVHGATELVGSQGDLLEALAQAVPVRLYQPDLGDPHGEKIRARWPWSFEVRPVRPASSQPSSRGSEQRNVPSVVPVPGGPPEELERVAREILDRLDEGVAPGEIAIVARTLESYASWLPVILERHGIPYSTSLSEPALLHPQGRSVLHLARALLGDLEREAVLELVRSPAFGRGSRVEDDGLPGLVERLARVAAVAHGRDDWEAALERAGDLLKEEPIRPSSRDLERLREIIDGLERDGKRVRQERSWKGKIRAIQDALDSWIPTPEEEPRVATPATGLLAREAARATLRGLESCDAIDEMIAHASEPTTEAVWDAIEETLGGASICPYAHDEGGVLVLDAIQARSIGFQHLLLIGVNESLWPRMLEEDPFLPDSVRSRLRDELHRPVPVRGEAETEEHNLFRLICSQALSSLTASFHRADSAGRAAAPSPYLRELVDRVPGAEALRQAVYNPDVTAQVVVPRKLVEPLPFRSALVEAALREGPDTLGALAEHGPAADAELLRRGLDYLAAVDALESVDLRFDGLVEPNPARTDGVLRPTHLEALGRCPLQAFFSNILCVPKFVERFSTELEARELGSLAHELLRDVYRRLYRSGHLQPGHDLAQAVGAATAELDRALEEERAGLTGIERRHPGVAAGLRRQLRAALGEFLEWDLERVLPDGIVNLRCEDGFERELELASGSIQVRGKVDLWVELPSDRYRVSDYKTGATPESSVRGREIEAGRALQLPLYALQVGQERGALQVEAEVLHVPLRPERLRGRRLEHAYRLEASSLEEIRAQIEPPVGVLTVLLIGGRFPFRRADHCNSCPYAFACRRTHPPTVARVRRAEEFRAYYEMAGA